MLTACSSFYKCLGEELSAPGGMSCNNYVIRPKKRNVTSKQNNSQTTIRFNHQFKCHRFKRHLFKRHQFKRHRFKRNRFKRHRFKRHQLRGHKFKRHHLKRHKLKRHQPKCPLFETSQIQTSQIQTYCKRRHAQKLKNELFSHRRLFKLRYYRLFIYLLLNKRKDTQKYESEARLVGRHMKSN